MFSRFAAGRRGCPRAAAVAVLVLGLAAAGLAQDAVRLRPHLSADTLAYLEVPSLGQALDALKTHPLALVYQDSEVQAFLKPLLAYLEQGRAQVKETLGVEVEEIQALLRGRIEIAFVGMTDENGTARPDWAILVDVAGGEETARKLLGRLMEMAEAEGEEIVRLRLGEIDAWQLGGPFEVFCFLARGSVYLGTDRNRAMQLIAGKAEIAAPLDGNATFQAIAAKVNAGAAHGFCYANLRKFLELVVEMEADGQTDERSREIMHKVMDRAGVTDLTGFGTSFTLGPRGATEIWHLPTPGGRKGVLALYDALRPGLALPARLAAGTVFYWGARADLPQVYDTVLATLRDLGEDLGPGPMDEVNAALQQAESGEWGFKLREDLLAALGEEVSLSLGLPRDGGFIPDVLLAMSVKDRDKILGVLDGIQKQLPEGLVNVSRIPVDDVVMRVYKIEGVPVSPALAVTDDLLVFGIFSRSVRAFLRGYPENLAANAVFRGGVQALGLKDAGSASVLTFLDLKAAVRYLYETFGQMLWTIDPDDLPPGLDLALLPSTQALVRPLHPWLQMYQVEPEALTVVGQGPIPESLLMVAGFGTAFLFVGRAEVAEGPMREVPRPVEVAPPPPPEEEVIEEEPAPPCGTLGVEAEDLPAGGGARIVQVAQGSAAAAAGIQAGDVVVAMDGQKIANVDEAAALLARKKAGESVSLEIRRGAGVRTVTAVLK
ncbi:MAG: PDZ domain-containing protein [Planctomycetes bacterium]|nr:PDZ domain-containing protein [Planctomycetota bacterium]